MAKNKEEVVKLQTIVERLQGDKLSLEQQTEVLKREKESLHEITVGLRQEIQLLQSNLDKINLQRQQLNIEVEVLQNKISRLDGYNAELKQKNEDGQRLLREINEEVQSLGSILEERNRAVQAIDSIIQEKRKLVTDFNEQFTLLDAKKSEILKDIEKLKKEQSKEQDILNEKVRERVGIAQRELDLRSKELYIKELYERAGLEF